MKNHELARLRRRRTFADCRLAAIAAVVAVALVACLGVSRPAIADGGLETQKGGLFHRKGFIAPEIYRKKEDPARKSSSSGATTRVASRTTTTPAARRTTSKPRTQARSNRRRLPQRAVRQREQKIARNTPTPPQKQVRVASLTDTVPSANTTSAPQKSVTGGAARVAWAASSRCLAGRLRSAINHVARTYGRVRVNSTCRSRRHNRRVGGASRSYHLTGQAADLRVFGNIRAAARYLRSLGGGYKHYGGGLFHIDTGPRRSW